MVNVLLLRVEFKLARLRLISDSYMKYVPPQIKKSFIVAVTDLQSDCSN